MTYSLTAYGPYEGWKLSITGSEGRLEAQQFDTGPQAEDTCFHIKVFDREDGVMTYDMKKGTGSHGGADTKLLDNLFRAENSCGEKADPLGQRAGLRARSPVNFDWYCRQQKYPRGKNCENCRPGGA